MYEKLSDTFKGVAVKYLSNVDANPKKSNQHEIGGLKKAGIADIIGYPEEGIKLEIPATMVFISDDSDEIVSVVDTVTWYDTRFNNPERSAEYRMYYKSNDVTELFEESFFFLIAVTNDNELLLVFTPPCTYVEKQLRALFGASNVEVEHSLSKVNFTEKSIIVPVRLLLEQIGIDINPSTDNEPNYLDKIKCKFGHNFPKTKPFSKFARDIFNNEDVSIVDPDQALVSWMETEEKLFRVLEREIVKEKLKVGFGERGDDVDEFISFSLSVQNRRKSRVGHAFENHIQQILEDNDITFKRGGKTEGKQTPDFLFPGEDEYKNLSFEGSKLRMLGAKTTCKDRWRQVLAEANRIERKHLITLQSSISEDQTTEMATKKLQLVVPKPIHPTYTESQQEWLCTLGQFVEEVKGIQSL